MPVEVVLVRSDTVIDAITATGQIEPLQAIELRAQGTGRPRMWSAPKPR